MNNCLKTQLKAVVENENLPVIDAIKFKVISNFSGQYLFGSPSVIIKKNGTTVEKNTYNYVTLSAQAGDIITASPKNDVEGSTITMFGHIVDTGLKGFSFDGITYLQNVAYTQSDIDYLNGIQSIGTLRLQNAPALNINALASIPIKKLYVAFSQIIADIKTFASQNTTLQSIVDTNTTSRNPITWPVDTRPSSYPIISVFGLANNGLYWSKAAIVGFLANMANCQVSSDDTDKKIELNSTDGEVTGIDDSVATLKGKGYSIKINGTSL